MTSWRLRALAVGVIAVSLAAAGQSRAQTTGLSVQSITQMSLGEVASGAHGPTTFHISESTGGVTVVSGQGVRMGSGSARALVTIACGTAAQCGSRAARIRIGSLGSLTGRAQALRNFAVSMDTAILLGAAGPADPLQFSIAPVGKNGTAKFYVGADWPIQGDDSGLASGASAAGFYVYVAFEPTTPTAGSTGGLATTTVNRALGLSSSGSLDFGALVRPSLTSGLAVVGAADGAYHNVNLTALPSARPGRVLFTASGEPGKVISLAIPGQFTLNRAGGGSLTVDLSSTAGASAVLNASGVFQFGVGGSMPVAAGAPTGVYSGVFTVSVAYN